MPRSALSALDTCISSLDNGLRTLFAKAIEGPGTPGNELPEAEMSEDERREAGALMRVNHVGEICAQALYQAQAVTSPDAGLRQHFLAAAEEERAHLAWTQQRIQELGTHRSRLVPLWYLGAFGIGLVAGIAGRGRSLGFVVETERQVEQHLASHLDRLPAQDRRSRAIVERMKDDEARHAQQASEAGGVELPLPVRQAMRAAAGVMTRVAHHI